jgi:hypothetical protein
MQSYPLSKINFAVSVTSASIANRASFITSNVLTASIALNFSGSIGPSGSSYTKYGAVGPTGPGGPSGSQGLGIYLLSSSRALCCNIWSAPIWRGTTDSSGFSDCSNLTKYADSLGASLYTTCSIVPTNNCKIFTSTNCAAGTIVEYNAINDGSNYWTLTAGRITGTGACTT